MELTAGAAEVLPIVDADLRKQAARVSEKAKEFCASKSVCISQIYLWSCVFVIIPSYVPEIELALFQYMIVIV